MSAIRAARPVTPQREGAGLASRPVRVAVHGDDPVLRAGVAAQLRCRCEVVDTVDPDQAAVVIVAADELDDPTLHVARRVHRDGDRAVVLVLSHLDDSALLAGVEAGASGFVRRCEAVPDRLVPVIVAASRGEASIPPDLVGGLLTNLTKLQSRSGDGSRGDVDGLSRREVDVLRLASEGLETAEIARRLAYSERTVKGVIHDVTTRYHLKNRTHTVAYAVRAGLI